MKTSNINVAFHRLENQDCHTVHMHMLIWLKNLGTVNLNHLRATRPNDHTYLSYLVKIIFHLQYSFLTNNTPHFVFPSKISVFFCNFKTHFIYRCNSYNHQINEIQALNSIMIAPLSKIQLLNFITTKITTAKC